MQIILQLGSIAVPFAIGITINHANSMPFFSYSIGNGRFASPPALRPQNHKTLDFIGYRGACPQFSCGQTFACLTDSTSAMYMICRSSAEE